MWVFTVYVNDLCVPATMMWKEENMTFGKCKNGPRSKIQAENLPTLFLKMNILHGKAILIVDRGDTDN